MATGYENNYGSDWTRQRNLDDVTDCDMSTELGTTLSKSTAAPAPHFNAYHLLVMLPRAAVLDGLTSKPMGLTDFKRFLNLIRQGAYQEHCNSWISSAPMLVDFLLDFKRYADGFSRLSLRDQSQCPHPFEIICHLNLQTPDDSLDSKCRETSAMMPHPAMELTNPNPPASRKVNWAPSVRSNNHQHDPDLDGTGSTLSATVHEGSILRTARYNSKAPSQLSSNFLMHKLKGVEPDHQPMRTAFNTLMMKYLGNSTSLEQRDGLLSSCDDINFESIQRTNLEAKYTNHPAVLSGIVAEILVGLNQHVLPAFVDYSITSQRTQTNARSQTLWGSYTKTLPTPVIPSDLDGNRSDSQGAHEDLLVNPSMFQQEDMKQAEYCTKSQHA
ncbi:hypothetical protein KEM48_001091 [Puccinia striiformis f. sp. tritici PST-130]|nr:hypothetical protein KEM48_001091 [Puccinia striiformis f. sp. tritici PST-130]